MFCILDVPASNLGPESGYLADIYHDFPQSIEANAMFPPYILYSLLTNNLAVHITSFNNGKRRYINRE
jgi:hypothetical protein